MLSEDEENNISSAEEEQDLEIIEEPIVIEGTEQNDEGNTADGEDQEADEKKETKVKRVRNPQPKLNADTLKGPRGIGVLEDLFKDVKFQGRGHEEEDLSLLMKTYEYWCHRLFPKFPFDACLERLERLGSKKPVQTYMKRIRLNMLDEHEMPVNNLDDDDDDGDDNDILRDLGEGPSNTLQDLTQQQTQQPPINQALSEEQLERMRINRERAQRLRQQALIRKKVEARSVVDSVDNSLLTIEEPTSQDSSVITTLNEVDDAQMESCSTQSETDNTNPSENV